MEDLTTINQDEILKFLTDETLQLDETQTEVEEQEVTQVEEEVTTEVPAETVETETYKAVQVLLKTGQIEDVEVEVEGEVVKLSEFKNLDEDTFTQIMTSLKEEEKNSLKTDYIKVKDLDEKRKALVSIITKGNLNEVTNILTDPDVLSEPFQGYDVNNEDHNAQVYFNYLTKVKGIDQEDAKELVQSASKNLTLDKKALEIVQTSKEAHINMLKQKADAIKEAEKKEKEDLKVYSKELNSTLQSYELKPEKVIEITKLATSKDSEGNLLIDNLYEDMAKDPVKAAELFLFLTDKELYDKRVGAKQKTEAEISIAKKIRLIPDSKKKTNTEEDKPQERKKNIQEFLMEDFKIK